MSGSNACSVRKRLSVAAMAGGLSVAAGLSAATPETSKLFDKCVDPKSGVVSYILRPGLHSHNQQSIYFTAKSMTEDGRFLLFDTSPDEFEVVNGKRVKVKKEKAVIDFEKDEIIAMPGIGGQIPFMDTANARVVYTTLEGVWERRLREDPRVPHLLCRFPPELIERGRHTPRYHTHLTLTSDGSGAFLDAYVNGSFVQGMLNLKTGTFEKWGSVEFNCNHGQLNPSNDRQAMCAWEYAWEKRQWNRERTELLRLPRPKEDVYPRLWIMEPERDYRWFPPIEDGYATHEHWDSDGRGFYWCCGSGIYHHDLASGLQERVCPIYAGHAMRTIDKRAFAFDRPDGKWWRGCAWNVNFWNYETSRHVLIHSRMEPYAKEDNASYLHPDPHPQFVCGDRYVVCTRNSSGRMDLSVTPVAQLWEMTSVPDAKLPPRKTFDLEWDPSWDVSVPWEVTIDRMKLEKRAGCDRLRAFGVYAHTPNGERRLEVATLKSKMKSNEYILRFRVPSGTTRLMCAFNEPERFRVGDAAEVDNLFAGALRTGGLVRWTSDDAISRAWRAGGITLAGGVANGEAVASIEATVPEYAAGKPVKFEIDVRNRAKFPWRNPIRLLQFDAQGNRLPESVVSSSDVTFVRPVDKTTRHRADGTLSPKAAKVRLEVAFTRPATLDDDMGRPLAEPGENVLEITRLALRPARTIPFPGYRPDGKRDTYVTIGGERVKYYPDTVQRFAKPENSHRLAKSVDASSFASLEDTLLKGVSDDAERADRVFGWLCENVKDVQPAQAVPYFVRAAHLPAEARPDIGPGFMQVFFGGRNHAFDLAAKTYRPAYGRETSAAPSEL